MSIYDKELRQKLRAVAGNDQAKRDVAMWYVELMTTGKVDEDTLSAFEVRYFDEIARAFLEWCKETKQLH